MYLLLEILEPKLLVALGEKADNELEWMDLTDEMDILRLNHDTWARRYGKESTFVKHIKEIYKRGRELSIV